MGKRQKKDTFLNLGIKSSKGASESETLKFFRFKDGAVNTFDKELAKTWTTKGFELHDVITLNASDYRKLQRLYFQYAQISALPSKT